MKSILRGIQADLDEFIVNPTLSLLVVACKIEHSALLIKSLDALEQDPAAPDIFLTFGHEFNDQPAYVEGVLATVRQEVAQISCLTNSSAGAHRKRLPRERAIGGIGGGLGESGRYE